MREKPVFAIRGTHVHVLWLILLPALISSSGCVCSVRIQYRQVWLYTCCLRTRIDMLPVR